nr:hypothetical protein [uncultured Albidiferax sp.]
MHAIPQSVSFASSMLQSDAFGVFSGNGWEAPVDGLFGGMDIFGGIRKKTNKSQWSAHYYRNALSSQDHAHMVCAKVPCSLPRYGIK